MKHSPLVYLVTIASALSGAALGCGSDSKSSGASDSRVADAQITRGRACGVVSEGKVSGYRSGSLVPSDDSTVFVAVSNESRARAYDACIANCYTSKDTSCEEISKNLCDGATSDRLSSCFSHCSLVELRCADGSGSYSLMEACDGDARCKDRSDEIDCLFVTQRCDDGTEIDLAAVLCDGRNDCPDGSDEAQCGEERYCDDSGQRLTWQQTCDGSKDCEDGSDEQGCPERFTCGDSSISIPMEAVCNLRPDCPDGSDESEALGCAKLTCPGGERFTCGDGASVAQSAACDGTVDCEDGSDELRCGGSGTGGTGGGASGSTGGGSGSTTGGSGYTCSDGTEIPSFYLCDDVQDCPSGEDERSCDGSIDIPDNPSDSPFPTCTRDDVVSMVGPLGAQWTGAAPWTQADLTACMSTCPSAQFSCYGDMCTNGEQFVDCFLGEIAYCAGDAPTPTCEEEHRIFGCCLIDANCVASTDQAAYDACIQDSCANELQDFFSCAQNTCGQQAIGTCVQ